MALVTRTILRAHAHIILARSNDARKIAWDVVGYRHSRELVRVIRGTIAAGVTPTAIAVDRISGDAIKALPTIAMTTAIASHTDRQSLWTVLGG